MNAVAGGPCYICGKNPATGYASSWTAKDGERWYCHGDDDETPTCYERHDPPERPFMSELFGNPPVRGTHP